MNKKFYHTNWFFIICTILTFLALSCIVQSQETSITATITDSDNTIWTNAKWRVIFIPNPSYPNINTYNINGVPITTTYRVLLDQSGITDGSGNLSVTLLDNTVISPSGSTWSFSIQPNASVQGVQYPNIAVSGSSESLTTFLSSNSIAPRFSASPTAYGYSDTEVLTVPYQGGTYFNVTSQTTRQYNNLTNSWVTLGPGGGIVPYVVNGIPYSSVVDAVNGLNASSDTAGWVDARGSGRLGASANILDGIILSKPTYLWLGPFTYTSTTNPPVIAAEGTTIDGTPDTDNNLSNPNGGVETFTNTGIIVGSTSCYSVHGSCPGETVSNIHLHGLSYGSGGILNGGTIGILFPQITNNPKLMNVNIDDAYTCVAMTKTSTGSTVSLRANRNEWNYCYIGAYIFNSNYIYFWGNDISISQYAALFLQGVSHVDIWGNSFGNSGFLLNSDSTSDYPGNVAPTGGAIVVDGNSINVRIHNNDIIDSGRNINGPPPTYNNGDGIVFTSDPSDDSEYNNKIEGAYGAGVDANSDVSNVILGPDDIRNTGDWNYVDYMADTSTSNILFNIGQSWDTICNVGSTNLISASYGWGTACPIHSFDNIPRYWTETQINVADILPPTANWGSVSLTPNTSNSQHFLGITPQGYTLQGLPLYMNLPAFNGTYTFWGLNNGYNYFVVQIRTPAITQTMVVNESSCTTSSAGSLFQNVSAVVDTYANNYCKVSWYTPGTVTSVYWYISPNGTTTTFAGDGTSAVNIYRPMIYQPPPVTGGTVIYTSSTIASLQDNGKTVIMDCTSCSYTLPATQPLNTFITTVYSWSTSVTIVLSDSTWNNQSVAPALNEYRGLRIVANSTSASDYDGEGPLIAGSGIILTPSAYGLTISASASVPPTIQSLCTGIAGASQTGGLYLLGSTTISCSNSIHISGDAPIIARNGTVSNLQVACANAGVNSSSGVFTVVVGGTATSVTCTVGTGTSCFDLSDTASISAGQRIWVQFTSQTGETLGNCSASFEY